MLTVRFEREGDQWAAECLELGTATCADTRQEAEEAIAEAIELHLTGLEEHGERERFFREHRITIYPAPPGKKPRAKRVAVPPEGMVCRDYHKLVPA